LMPRRMDAVKDPSRFKNSSLSFDINNRASRGLRCPYQPAPRQAG
jgi:hypothetical protein